MSTKKQIVKVILDEQTGFPLLDIPGLEFTVSWLPVTRIQLELFLCDTNDARFNAEWYTRLICRDNLRVSPNNVNKTNIHGIFATNILFPEARQIVKWFGSMYELPTREQWEEIFVVSRGCSPMQLDILPDKIDPRAKTLITRLHNAIHPQTLAEQMVIIYDMSEYVSDDDVRQTCSSTDVRQGKVQPFSSSFASDGNRQKKLTFRLIRRTIEEEKHG